MCYICVHVLEVMYMQNWYESLMLHSFRILFTVNMCGPPKTLSWSGVQESWIPEKNCISTSQLKMAEGSRLNSKCNDWCSNMTIATVWYFKSSEKHYRWSVYKMCSVNTLVMHRTVQHKNRRWLCPVLGHGWVLECSRLFSRSHNHDFILSINTISRCEWNTA